MSSLLTILFLLLSLLPSLPSARRLPISLSSPPLFSAPLPGGTSGRFVIPSTPTLRALLSDISNDLRAAGPAAGFVRSLQAQRALLSTAFDVRDDALVRAALQSRSAPDPKTLARVFRTLFEKLGATYVKLGQFVASSPTLFPEDVVLEFQKCLDQTPSVPFSQVRQVIEEDLGQPIERLFRRLDPVPLASASIAQVHAAELFTGERVVVKVRKPGVEEVLQTDLAFLSVATKVLEAFAPELRRVSLADITSDIRDSMLGELDFETEADNLRVFDAFLTRMGLTDAATCPLPVPSLTSRRVLTMSRLDGKPLLDAEVMAGVESRGRAEEAVVTALNVWSMSVVSCDFFHADVHGGNLMLLDDGRIGFLDFGIVSRLSQKVYDAVVGLGQAFAEADYRAMAESLVNMGAADDAVDTVAFGRDLEAIVARMQGVQPSVTVETDGQGAFASMDVDEAEVSRIVIDVVNAAENNGLKLPREFGLLTKQALYFDRYLKSLAPGLDPLNDPRVRLAGQA